MVNRINFSSYPSHKFSNLIDLLHYRAVYQPKQTAYIFLQDGEIETKRITYQELEQKAREIAATLQNLKLSSGDRAILLYPSGLDFICAFLGCVYAGVIAVPAYPPRSNHSMSRLMTIVADAEATVALTTSTLSVKIQNWLAKFPKFAAIKILKTDKAPENFQNSWQELSVTQDTLAFLQYTSGSIAKPKGVMVSHGNLMHNEQLIEMAFGHTNQTVVVGWLPLFHDMGLIGNVLQPLYLGVPSIFMPPATFLQSPLRWLQTISRYKATTSGGPNFAYDLCVRKITPEQRINLDLSSWSVAFNGSEPIRAETLERFADAFNQCGFRASAFYPCYGMAETTLIVSGGLKTASPVIKNFQKDSLLVNKRHLTNQDDVNAQTFVGCGKPLSDLQVVIAHPEKKTRCQFDEVGEIWVSGASVAKGYWNYSDLTQQTFQAYLADTNEGPFLQTGDLGFFKDGELFVTGRYKDVIIIRGRNYYPQDIELTVEQSHPALRLNCGAAFAVEVEGEKRLAIVQEVERSHLRNLNTEEIVIAIRQAVAQQHELEVYAVLLLKTGSIPKTSSGKIQRSNCRTGFLDGSLATLGQWYQDKFLHEFSKNLGIEHNSFDFKDRQNKPLSSLVIEKRLISQLACYRGLTPKNIGLFRSFSDYGLTSLEAVKLVEYLESWLGRSLPSTLIWDYPSITALAEALVQPHTSGLISSLNHNRSYTIDLEAEAILEPTICSKIQSAELVTNPTNILLTGATGFLGSFLLHELLQHTQANVYCLIRSSNVESAKKRLQNRLEFYRLWNQNTNNRIIPVLGDLSQPYLGLAEAEFQSLSRQIDTIYHSGALLDFTYPYTTLKAINVTGTQEVLRLAGQFKPKPLHYVSSIAVFESKTDPQKIVTELDIPSNSERVYLGYSQSKWVAEKLVLAARDRGLPVCIYRPSLISGDSRTGIWNTDDFVCRLIKGCIQMGKAPELDYQVDIAPVDYVSQAIINLSKQKTSFGKAFHLINSSPIHWKQWIKYINCNGYSIEQIPYTEWQKHLTHAKNNYTNNILYPLKPFFSRKLSTEQLSIPELYQNNKKSKIHGKKTLNLLDSSSIKCPVLDYQLLKTYFSYFIKSGFLLTGSNRSLPHKGRFFTK
jgi:thioester reductase-like protein